MDLSLIPRKFAENLELSNVRLKEIYFIVRETVLRAVYLQYNDGRSKSETS